MGRGEEPKHSVAMKTGSCSDKTEVFPGGCSDTHTHAVFSKMKNKYRYLQVFISLLLATNYSIPNKT